jgi:hypothetical protein
MSEAHATNVDTRLALRLYDEGHPIHSIAPHGTSHISPGSKLTPAKLGKIPTAVGPHGVYSWNWTTARQSRDSLAQSLNAGFGYGIRCDEVLGLDVDSDDTRVAAIVNEVLDELLGSALQRRTRPGSNRFLVSLPVSATHGIAKSVLHLANDAGGLGAIELLGTGRQFVCEGMHKSGSYLQWNTPFDPVYRGRLTKDLVDDLWSTLRERLTDAGIVSMESVSSAVRGTGTGDQAPSVQHVRDAVERIPNTEETDRNAFVGIGYAIKAAVGEENEDAGLEIYQNWCARWPGGNDPNDVASTWSTLRDPENGWNYLCEKAVGYIPPEEFAEPLPAGFVLPVARVHIRCSGDLTALTDASIAALASRPGVYVRAGELVEIARDGSNSKDWLKREPHAPIIRGIDKARLTALLDLSTYWYKVVNKAERQVFPLPAVVEQVAARLEWPFSYLEGVTETPVMRKDGSVLTTPGFDEATGLLYLQSPNAATWPTIPELPTAQQVTAAVGQLFEVVHDFPFVADSDKSAWLAAVLTLIGRNLIDGPTPLFPVRAPTPGTGKGLLVTVASVIGTGRNVAVASMTADDEMRKWITSLAMEGSPSVLLDNVSGSLGSDTLARATTATNWSDRRLGSNSTVDLPLRTVWFATGNNLNFAKTLGRRVVPIDLDAKMANPENRGAFRQDNLTDYVRSSRPQLVAAALTILRGFYAAGVPRHGGLRMGSFESWDDVVRSAVIWAGCADPAALDDPTRGRGRIAASLEDDLEDMIHLLAEIHAWIVQRQRANRKLDDTWTVSDVWAAPSTSALRSAINAAAPAKGRKEATESSLRYALRSIVNRPLPQYMLRYGEGGTQRVRRFRIAADHDVVVDGVPEEPPTVLESVVDLSSLI